MPLSSKSLKIISGILLLGAIFVPRLLSLGTMLTVDENLWRGRGEQFIKGLASGHFEKTLTAGQPGVTTTWLVGLSYPWKSLAVNQAAIGLATGLLILIITYGLVRLWGFRWGMVGGFLLALDPFLLAHSRLVHTDALFALFYLASLVYLLVGLWPAFENRPLLRRHIVLSGLFGALALLTKIFAIILLPTAALLLLIVGRKAKIPFSNLVFVGLLWLITFTLSIFALWPALWVIPTEVAQYLTGRATLHVGEGTHAGETTTMWWYYLRETFFRLSPITLLLLIPGIAYVWQKKDLMRLTSLILILSGIAFALILSFGTDKSDRYILFTFLTLDLFAVMGLRFVAERVQKLALKPRPTNSGDLAGGAGLHNVKNSQEQWSQNFVGLGFIILIIFLFALDSLSPHPYYLAYYNRFYQVEREHKLGWGEGLEQAAAWLEANHPGAKILSYYPSVMKNWYSGEVDPLNHIDESNAPYVVLYRSAFERSDESSDTEVVKRYLNNPNRQPLHVVYINRLPYVWIYGH